MRVEPSSSAIEQIRQSLAADKRFLALAHQLLQLALGTLLGNVLDLLAIALFKSRHFLSLFATEL